MRLVVCIVVFFVTLMALGQWYHSQVHSMDSQTIESFRAKLQESVLIEKCNDALTHNRLIYNQFKLKTTQNMKLLNSLCSLTSRRRATEQEQVIKLQGELNKLQQEIEGYDAG